MDVEVSEAAAATITNGLVGGESSSSAAPAPFYAEQLDVKAYAAQYKGRTRLPRLLFIAQRCGAESFELEALQMAHDEARAREDTGLYRDAAHKIGGRLGPRYRYDQGWVDAVNRRAEQRKEKLENELNGYRNSMHADRIRMGYNDIGDFYYGHGLLSEAFESYICTEDYCRTGEHVVQMCMHVILVSIQLGQFAHITDHVKKAEEARGKLEPIVIAKLRAAAGLAFLETKKYKHAACKFLETGSELESNYSEVIAPQDVAVYGALCALASLDRSDLKRKLIDNVDFRYFLELVPEVRELVNDFYSSRYGSCLEHLEKLKPNLLLDIHLHEHLEALYKDIRHKAIIQYTIPFISVDLNTMADAFKTSVSMLEKELAALITDNKIKARIDSHNKILYARHTDERSASFQRVLQTCSEFERDAKAMLLRASLLKHDFDKLNFDELSIAESEKHKLALLQVVPDSQKNERGRPFVHGKGGLLWLHLEPMIERMIYHTNVALALLLNLSRKLNSIQEGINNLYDPNQPALQVPLVLRQNSLKWAIRDATALLIDHFSPEAATRPLVSVNQGTVELLEEQPNDLLTSILRFEYGAGVVGSIASITQSLNMVQQATGDCGASMLVVSDLMDFQNENFIQFGQNGVNRSESLADAINLARDALTELEAIRERIRGLNPDVHWLLRFREFASASD